MGTLYKAIRDIPAQGCDIFVDDSAVWSVPMQEFDVECKVLSPLKAQLSLLLVPGGCLVRGTLSGQVAQPCDLCSEDAITSIEHEIDTFEAIPGESVPFEDEEDEEDADMAHELMDRDGHIVMENGIPMLDIAGLCWEEFLLSLPMRPLCRENCKGLCTDCGANLNATSCACVKDEGDPRLAALRTLKIASK